MGGKWGVTANGYEVSLRGDKNVLKQIALMVAQLCEHSKNQSCTFISIIYNVNFISIKLFKIIKKKTKNTTLWNNSACQSHQT